MHRLWTTAATVITMLGAADAALARDRPSPPRTDPPPPLPYRLDGIANAQPPGLAAPTPPASPTAQAAQPSATGSVRGGYYYPPPITMTTVIEYRRR